MTDPMHPDQPMRPTGDTRRPPTERSKVDPRGDPTRCGHWGGRRKADGKPCVGRVVAGTKRCRMHQGKPLARAKAEGQVVKELLQWGLDGPTELADPGETLLRLVTQASARCELYARLLREAFEAANRLQRAAGVDSLVEITLNDPEPAYDDHDNEIPEDPAVAVARADLRRVLASGGVAALIGYRYDADRHGRVYPAAEAIRGLVDLEAKERDRCANFAAKAVAAGLAERMVRIADRQGQLLAAVIQRILDRLDLDDRQRQLVPEIVTQEIGALLGAAA